MHLLIVIFFQEKRRIIKLNWRNCKNRDTVLEDYQAGIDPSFVVKYSQKCK